MTTGFHWFAFHHIFGTALCILSFSPFSFSKWFPRLCKLLGSMVRTSSWVEGRGNGWSAGFEWDGTLVTHKLEQFIIHTFQNHQELSPLQNRC
jgi:hypothetical protein